MKTQIKHDCGGYLIDDRAVGWGRHLAIRCTNSCALDHDTREHFATVIDNHR